MNLTKHWTAFIVDHEFRESQSEDPIEYSLKEHHKTGYVSDNNLHRQFRRDYLVRARYGLELLKICSFSYSDIGDKKKTILFTNEVMQGVTSYIQKESGTLTKCLKSVVSQEITSLCKALKKKQVNTVS